MDYDVNEKLQEAITAATNRGLIVESVTIDEAGVSICTKPAIDLSDGCKMLMASSVDATDGESALRWAQAAQTFADTMITLRGNGFKVS